MVGERAFSCDGIEACRMPVWGMTHRPQRPPKSWPGGQGPATLTVEGAPFPGKEGRTHTGDSKAAGRPPDTTAHEKGGGSSWVPRGLGGARGGWGHPVDEAGTQSPSQPALWGEWEGMAPCGG